MRKADAVELLDVRTFITTEGFGGELFHTYERGDAEDVECQTIEAESEGTTLTFRVTGKPKSDPKAKPWTHEYTYNGCYLVHWADS